MGMESELARHFSTVRRTKGIRLGQLARLVSYQNISKGANRIDKFEKSGQIQGELLVKLAAALGIEQATVASLIEQDRQRYLQEWTAWADTPIHPSLIFGHVGGFCWGQTLPAGMPQDAAEEHAAKVAREMERKILLVFSRRLSIWFDRDGNRTFVTKATSDTVVPYLRMGSRKFTFDLAAGEPKMLGMPASDYFQKSSCQVPTHNRLENS